MALAILTTLAITHRLDLALGALAIGAVIGVIVSKRVQMTQMPELVAAMHSLVGLAAVLIAFAVVNEPSAFGVDVPIPPGKLAGLGKYSRLFSSAPVVFKAQHYVNLALAIVMVASGMVFFTAAPEAQWPPFIVMTERAGLSAAGDAPADSTVSCTPVSFSDNCDIGV